MPAAASALVDLDQLEGYRRELTGYCYRMLGSGFEADDAVQETMLRAWRAGDGFEGRSSVRSWLYRIATNICLDMLRGRQRRALPMDLGPASPPVEALFGDSRPDEAWISPIADERVVPEHGDPADIAVARDTIRLAFVTALQYLPARQRATLIMCEVLRMPATEAAATLGTSVAAVNSALQRARVTLAALPVDQRPVRVQADQAGLLAGYVDAFQRYDLDQLVTLLQRDAVMTMPPYTLWLKGAADIRRWMASPGARQCRDSVLVPAGQVNGVAAWAQYRPDPAGGYVPWALQVHEAWDGKFGRLTYFLDTGRVFPAFGLPPRLLRRSAPVV
jgi:RNA polymerase sigma-70 factor, ECF subfamily